MNRRLRIVAAVLIWLIAFIVFGAVWLRKAELDRALRPLEKLGFGKAAGVAIDPELR